VRRSFQTVSRRVLLGNLQSYTRVPIRYRGVGKRACSPGFLEEFFSETGLPPDKGMCTAALGTIMSMRVKVGAAERRRVYN
jgi:hypothetical protein